MSITDSHYKCNRRLNSSYLVCSLLRLKLNPFRFLRLNYIIVWHWGDEIFSESAKRPCDLIRCPTPTLGLCTAICFVRVTGSALPFQCTGLHNITITINSETPLPIQVHVNFKSHCFNMLLNSLISEKITSLISLSRHCFGKSIVMFLNTVTLSLKYNHIQFLESI